jgi:hypothetical protein
MKKSLATGLFALLLGFLGGCATPPQQAVPLSSTSLAGSSGRVGVVMSALPAVDTAFPGANCLLCIATAATIGSKLTDHARTLKAGELSTLPKEALQVLGKRGVTTVDIPAAFQLETLPDHPGAGTPNVARKSFASFRSAHNVEKLLVIDIGFVGFERTFAAYVPTADPKALVAGAVYLVNLTNNTYEWYQPIAIRRSSDGAWDEPPTYPGLTNAFYQALELTRDSVLKPLAP